jgi:hypothetical protein
MPQGPGTFSVGQIVLSALIGTVVSFVVVWSYGRWSKEAALTAAESVIVAVLAGLSILVWRLAGNTQALNEDPIAFVSPNDVLGPVLTYVVLGLYADMRRGIDRPAWGRVRALLTLTSLIVNIVTI